ncbi:MAG: alanine transaminase [Deltaproteobacteria bacterium RIFCSPLOWO2_02_FULL_50_16]|nr:MAG: alanine transaminase [Deltaproteobacteria bacterium GWA2_50_8]OGQ25618.1 MAG: alanine transaminase [Deltaproteobacteria bacterium RIFCSPHIGHO2_02_FULL_50_15]OGQ55852.1 MAG: alanine transaminase [Deltaproteobacteria bacterium RIFCSPLOWO2_02_FULL_50_16]OGQ67957.1 MAG: alanine transaminase [Deltaproteobacteria bacterium RIFCSPLOWO2_12_FULL_50_11]
MKHKSETQFERIRRLPPYILGEVVAMMMAARRQGEDIINLGMGNPDLPTPPHIVAKLQEAASKPKNHRYSLSRGIPKLREAITKWYKTNYNVLLNPETEVVATMGAKEGLSHLVLALTNPGDVFLVPNPTYPIHTYSVVIAGGDARSIRMSPEIDFFTSLELASKTIWPKAKYIIVSFPSNPTTEIVDLDFFKKLVAFAKENNLLIIHDLAYADLVFDGYKAPSILQVKGGKDVAVELYSMSKGYSMPGWRIAFCVGNKKMVYALTKIKSYLDYGVFAPIQIAATVALNGPQHCVKEIRDTYCRRRDVLCEGLNRIGWAVERPKATMFVWAKIPEDFRKMGSLKFSKHLLQEAKVAVSPGVGFGEYGEGYVRFALVENEKRIQQAVRGIQNFFKAGA